jgi:hypothetical protein
MADTKRGREEQARNAARRQREREVEQARQRRDEPEPSRERAGDETSEDETPTHCHRRDCDEPATFLVLERYLEETGHGAVEARVALCRDHTAEESPTRLDDAYADYVFRIEPLPGTAEAFEP